MQNLLSGHFHAGSTYRLFSFTSKWFFSLTCFHSFFMDPLPSFNWWAVSVGGEELKWHQLAHHQLMSQQGPHFNPHSIAKAKIKAQISGRMLSSGISDVAFSSVYTE